MKVKLAVIEHMRNPGKGWYVYGTFVWNGDERGFIALAGPFVGKETAELNMIGQGSFVEVRCAPVACSL